MKHTRNKLWKSKKLSKTLKNFPKLQNTFQNSIKLFVLTWSVVHCRGRSILEYWPWRRHIQIGITAAAAVCPAIVLAAGQAKGSGSPGPSSKPDEPHRHPQQVLIKSLRQLSTSLTTHFIFRFIPYSLGCGASCDSSDILA